MGIAAIMAVVAILFTLKSLVVGTANAFAEDVIGTVAIAAGGILFLFWADNHRDHDFLRQVAIAPVLIAFLGMSFDSAWLLILGVVFWVVLGVAMAKEWTNGHAVGTLAAALIASLFLFGGLYYAVVPAGPGPGPGGSQNYVVMASTLTASVATDILATPATACTSLALTWTPGASGTYTGVMATAISSGIGLTINPNSATGGSPGGFNIQMNEKVQTTMAGSAAAYLSATCIEIAFVNTYLSSTLPIPPGGGTPNVPLQMKIDSITTNAPRGPSATQTAANTTTQALPASVFHQDSTGNAAGQWYLWTKGIAGQFTNLACPVQTSTANCFRSSQILPSSGFGWGDVGASSGISTGTLTLAIVVNSIGPFGYNSVVGDSYSIQFEIGLPQSACIAGAGGCYYLPSFVNTLTITRTQ